MSIFPIKRLEVYIEVYVITQLNLNDVISIFRLNIKDFGTHHGICNDEQFCNQLSCFNFKCVQRISINN